MTYLEWRNLCDETHRFKLDTLDFSYNNSKVVVYLIVKYSFKKHLTNAKRISDCVFVIYNGKLQED